MIKYALKMIAGQDPQKVIDSMPDEDFEKLATFVSGIQGAGMPRKQRRAIERKWDKTYGKQPRKNKKI